MKLLLTGQPKNGKSTALGKVIRAIEPKYGFLTQEILINGRREGFQAIAHNKSLQIIAQTEHATPNQLGRYFIDIEGVNEFILSLQKPGTDDLLYIDEIGQMQLMSFEFRKLVNKYMEMPNDLIATITSVYQDDIVLDLRNRKEIIHLTIKPGSRGEAVEAMLTALNCRHKYNKLPLSAQLKFNTMAENYFNRGQYVSYTKLFSHTINYVLTDSVRSVDSGHFLVKGEHGIHRVILKQRGDFSCDCLLANGLSPYSERSECSHFQASILSEFIE